MDMQQSERPGSDRILEPQLCHVRQAHSRGPDVEGQMMPSHPTQPHPGVKLLESLPCMPDRPPYAQAQALDPLDVDEFMQQLPGLTESRQLDTILNRLALVVRRLDERIYRSVASSFAALRDLEFMIASASILSANSHKQVQGLESVLEALGSFVDHAPRGCTFTYGLFNPDGARMRTFTGLDEERTFIRAIQQGTRHLDDGLVAVGTLSTVPIDSEDFEALTVQLTTEFESMVTAVVQVLRCVTADIFSGKIVTFFVPLDINGKVYSGITGAQVQNIGIDYLLFGADLKDERYIHYVSENMTAMLPFHRSVISGTLHQLKFRSLLAKLNGDVDCTGINCIQATRSLDSLRYFLQRVLSFRMVHRRLAVDNLPLRPIEKGSGGYNLDHLDFLILQTRHATRRIAELKAKLPKCDLQN
jgi:monodechloroaminopyrrolnitrin synthase